MKRILRYLSGTAHLGLSLQPSLDYKLVYYIDANWASYLDDNTSAYCIFLDANLISWASSK